MYNIYIYIYTLFKSLPDLIVLKEERGENANIAVEESRNIFVQRQLKQKKYHGEQQE